MSLPIAVQLYSVRDDVQNDFAATMHKIKDMGYDGVEFAGLYDMNADQVKSVLDECGLIPISAHIAVADMENNALMEEYKKIGIKYAAIPWYEYGEADSEALASAISKFKKLGELCKSFGFQMLYHNHDFEFKKINGKYMLDTIYDEISSDLLKTELDTCWVNVAGENPADYVKKYSGRAPLVHIKDFKGSKSENMYELIGNDEKKSDKAGEFEFRPVGHGVQDLQSILDASVAAGAKWVVVEQDSPSMGKTPLECIEMGIKSIKEKVW